MSEQTAPSSSIKIPSYVADLAIDSADTLVSIIPRRKPSPTQRQATQVISHRGQRDDKTVFENTFSAFDSLVDSTVAGIEFDIRWTKDLIPMVAHDSNLVRLFGDETVIAEATFFELRSAHPQIATLSEFVERYASRFFLTIELKQELWLDFEAQQDVLLGCLKNLKAGADYIVMSFDIELLQQLDKVDNRCKLGIAHSNVADVSDVVLQNGWAGIGGHYLMISTATIKRHKAAGQRIAIGFPKSKFSAYREVKRGTDWLFCDDALQVCKWLG
ncbi:MAG: glycerophosphoryl diester phosphodiesterase [Gammaproteobacteria bacterium]|jgi:glycerophosphoryl diester phosphodiesterase